MTTSRPAALTRPHASTCMCDLCVFRTVVTDVRPVFACEGGSVDCTGRIPTEYVDADEFPYCRPCRIAAAADAAQDDPEVGPLPEAPDLTAGLVDGLLADARRRDPGGHPTWWATQVERFVRRSVEVALVGLPTGGGTDRDRTADQLAHYAEALRILTRRMADGTADVRLYAEPSDEF